MLQMIETDSAH